MRRGFPSLYSSLPLTLPRRRFSLEASCYVPGAVTKHEKHYTKKGSRTTNDQRYDNDVELATRPQIGSGDANSLRVALLSQIERQSASVGRVLVHAIRKQVQYRSDDPELRLALVEAFAMLGSVEDAKKMNTAWQSEEMETRYRMLLLTAYSKAGRVEDLSTAAECIRREGYSLPAMLLPRLKLMAIESRLNAEDQMRFSTTDLKPTAATTKLSEEHYRQAELSWNCLSTAYAADDSSLWSMVSVAAFSCRLSGGGVVYEDRFLPWIERLEDHGFANSPQLYAEAVKGVGENLSAAIGIYRRQMIERIAPVPLTYQRLFEAAHLAMKRATGELDRRIVDFNRDMRKRGILHDENSAAAYLRALSADSTGQFVEEIAEFMEHIDQNTRMISTKLMRSIDLH